MKRLFFTLLLILAPLNSLFASDEIVWLKTRDDLGLANIKNAIFAPGDSTILVTDDTLKLVEINVLTGLIKREIPTIKGIFKFSDDTQFVYTYDFKKVNYHTGAIIGRLTPPSYGFDEFDVNEKAGLWIGVKYDSHQYPDTIARKMIYVYSLDSFKLIDTIGFSRSYYYHIKFTDDGKYFRTFSDYVWDYKNNVFNTRIYLWNAHTLDTIRQWTDLVNFKESPDGRWLGTVAGNTAKVFDAVTLEQKYVFQQATTGSLSAIDFTPDSRLMATAGTTGGEISNIHFWDMETGQLYYQYYNVNDGIGVPFLRFSYGGNYIIDYGGGGLCIFRNIDTDIPEIIIPQKSYVYPNPSTGEISLQNNLIKQGKLTIELINDAGKILKILYDGNYTNEELKFNLADYSNGNFLIKVRQNNFVNTYKIIKEK